MKDLVITAILLLVLFPGVLAAQDAHETLRTETVSGRLKMLNIYSREGVLQQQVRYHYIFRDGLWYPAADIVTSYARGADSPQYAETIYRYTDTLGHFLLSEIIVIGYDGTWTSNRYDYSADGELAAVSQTMDNVVQYELGFSPDDSISLATSRKLERWKTRSTAPQPMEQRRRLETAMSICSMDTSLVLSPVDGECFLFDESGRYLSRVHLKGHSNEMAIWRGGDGLLIAAFADPVEDPASLYTGTRAFVVSDGEILGSLELSGSFNPKRHGFLKGCLFLAAESGYGGTLDFAANGLHSIEYDGLYVTRTRREGIIAHNNFNYGNFLWGASARAVGVPLWVARLGSHFNNFFLSPDTRGTLDSPDDQFSISCGHHFLSEVRSNSR